ncbi:hypothetical protein LTS08_005627 [Lithohypha guttulata]|nr:hypothetical protein LTS08_005627 [Lithohypha guttulata]
MYSLSIILTVLATYFLSSYLPEPTTIIPWIAQSASPLELLTQTVVPSITSRVVDALESISGLPEPPRLDRNICEPVMFDSSDHATHDSIYRKTVCQPIPLPSRSEKLVAYTKYAIRLLKYAKDVALSTSSNSFLADLSLSVILNILFGATFSSLWYRSSKRATRISHLEDTNVKLNKNEAALKKQVEALKGNPKERQTEVHSSQRILQLTMERDDLKYKCSSLSLTCGNLRAERQELRNSTIRRSCFERRLEVFERAKAAAREKQIKTEELEKSLQDQIAIVREQNVNLQARDETIGVTVTDLETAKETMRRQRTALAREQQKIQSLAAELSALQDELKTEREACATEKTALMVAHEKELRKERRGFATKKATLIAAHRKELQELQTEKIELLAYKTECLELRDVSSKKQEELDALLSQNTVLDNKNQTLRQELSQMKKNQEKSEERTQKLQKESKTIREERDAEQEELTAAYEEMDKLENDRNSMSRTLEGVKAVCCEAASFVYVESYARQFFASLSGTQPGRRSRLTRVRRADRVVPVPNPRDAEDDVAGNAVNRPASSTVCSQAVIHIPTSSRALVLVPRKLCPSKDVAFSSWSLHIETTTTPRKIMALLMIEHKKAALSKYRLSPQTHIKRIQLPLSLDCMLSTTALASAATPFIGPVRAPSDDA